ncbi:uncharacterized protein LOC111790413 [Cucurbita pepo subsp. pepo]|uniref:uncharacterized protein LOC111790413 n=1 Tax=Cucurbita pepo subsp. pepo TaxID=3664 RepID=UPI000C9D6B21|nr:uncharacterized protein LOC111790413 [Cucurbita pepo subsp. pepo]
MDIPSVHQKLALLDVDGLDDLQSSLKEIDAALFSDLDGFFKKSLSLEDTQSSECKLAVNCCYNSNDRNKQKGLELPENNSANKRLSKSKSFPIPAVTSPPKESSDNEKKPQVATGDVSCNESMHQAFARSISLPAPVRLVSAMKGSRVQYYGESPKMTVTWAPDVYDPPQTSLCHSVKNNKKQQKSKNRKNGKKGQKGSNSSRGSGGGGGGGGGGRDKRQARKAASSDRYQKSFNPHESLVNTLNEYENFDDGSSDSHCGSIFLKTSLTKVHYSVTEAL